MATPLLHPTHNIVYRRRMIDDDDEEEEGRAHHFPYHRPVGLGKGKGKGKREIGGGQAGWQAGEKGESKARSGKKSGSLGEGKPRGTGQLAWLPSEHQQQRQQHQATATARPPSRCPCHKTTDTETERDRGVGVRRGSEGRGLRCEVWERWGSVCVRLPCQIVFRAFSPPLSLSRHSTSLSPPLFSLSPPSLTSTFYSSYSLPLLVSHQIPPSPFASHRALNPSLALCPLLSHRPPLQLFWVGTGGLLLLIGLIVLCFPFLSVALFVLWIPCGFCIFLGCASCPCRIIG